MKKVSKEEGIAVAVALVVVFGLLFYGNQIFQAFDPSTSNAAGGVSDIATTRAVKAGDSVSVHYVGTLVNGTKFDSSIDRGEPITFVVGAGQLIKGFDDGVVGMKVGEKKKLTISPEMGYGSQQVGPIPPNSTLIFEVEIVSIK